MNPLALYIHIPFCLAKCPYCDFHSIAMKKGDVPHSIYAKNLIQQLENEVKRLELENRPLLSIFFGGGTPSLMPPQFFEKILSEISKVFVLDSRTEITVETNPKTATKSDFKKWLELGINRASIGVQSFQDPLLKKLGRIHSAKEAKDALQNCLSAGFENINMDLIFGIPTQTFKNLEADLETAMSFQIPHISAYQLTVEPATPLAGQVSRGEVEMPPEENLVKMISMVVRLLECGGWCRYEISNFAKPDFECRHNLQYWRYGDYLGLGEGSVSCVEKKRWRTMRNFKKEEEEIIDDKTAWKERWMMGLRLKEGVILTENEAQLWGPNLVQWSEEGWIRRFSNPDRVTLTSKGFLFCNQIVRAVFDLIDKEKKYDRCASHSSK
ncbi:MAG: radical SAM family heme chaperone HemW [Deltaproteobacteria bacterium]|nr:radical SAM family heme chaperone HemW [Deltaproteobacteria bacterium]